MDEPEYLSWDDDRSLSKAELKAADRPKQLDVMRVWFHMNYEDPAENTPYESAEGGYQWIWGGPCLASDVLGAEFGDVVPEEAIEALADELDGEWAPKPSADDYDDYLLEYLAEITDYLDGFASAMLDVEHLLDTRVAGPVASTFYRLLYANVVAAVEAYLSDAFIGMVGAHPTLMRRFVETNPRYKEEKIALSDVYNVRETVEARVRSELLNIVWHNLFRILPMYERTLGIRAPGDYKELSDAILTRHHIVHRNGRDKEGNTIEFTADDVRKLVTAAEAFVRHIDQQVSEVRAKLANSEDSVDDVL